MDYEKLINDKIKSAMLAKEKLKLETFRAIKTAILNFKTSGKKEELNEAAFMKIIKQEAKKRKDAIALYLDAGRKELLEKEEIELEIIQKFLPQQMDEESIRTAIRDIINKSGASSMKDMGKVMGMAMKELKDKADGGLINKIVRELLSGDN